MTWWAQLLMQVVPMIVQFVINLFQKKAAKVALTKAEADNLNDLKNIQILVNRVIERNKK